MSPLRKTALAAGVLYILTFVSIPTLALYGPVKGANYILGPGPDTAVIVKGFKPSPILSSDLFSLWLWNPSPLERNSETLSHE